MLAGTFQPMSGGSGLAQRALTAQLRCSHGGTEGNLPLLKGVGCATPAGLCASLLEVQLIQRALCCHKQTVCGLVCPRSAGHPQQRAAQGASACSLLQERLGMFRYVQPRDAENLTFSLNRDFPAVEEFGELKAVWQETSTCTSCFVLFPFSPAAIQHCCQHLG